MRNKPSAGHAETREGLKSERGFVNAVLENAHALVVVLDHEGRIHRFNRACETLSGYSFEEVAGKFPWDTVLPPEDAETIRRQAFETLANNPQQMAGQYSNYWLSKSGQRYLIDWYNAVLLDDQGQMNFMVSVGIDVTEKHETEQALLRSQETYKRAEEMAHVGTWDWDILTGDLYWTDEIYRVFGQTPQSFSATYDAFLEAVHPDDRQRLIDAVNASVSDSAVAYDIEHRVQRPDGKIRFVRERGEVYRDKKGNSVRMIGTVLDQTEQKHAELELRRHKDDLAVLVKERTAELTESEALLRRAQEIANLGHWTVNVQTGELKWSDQIYRIFGKEPQSFQPSQLRFFESVHPDDVKKIGQAQDEAFATGKIFQVDHRIVLPDGTIRWVYEEAITETDVDGNPLRMAGIVQDITERKRVEEQLIVAKQEAERQGQRNEIILATALDAFMIVDMQGHILDVNPAYMDMLGYSYDEFLGMSIPDIEVLENTEKTAEHIQLVIAQGHDRFETQQRHKDGRAIDVEISTTVAEVGDEKFFFAFVRDITERRQAEKEILLAKEAAEKASNAKSDFLSRMSHELRTPMNAILGFSQLLELESLTEEQGSFIQEISYAGKHLLELIDELLDLTRIESGNMPVLMEPVEVLAMVQKALAIVQPVINQNSLNIKLECQRGIVVVADQLRLKQVLVNLLDNAAKYNRPGGEIRIHCKAGENNRLRIMISDTGKGIAAGDLGKLFAPFERLGVENRGIDGTGIGLVLCKQLVEMMNGEIGVESCAGQGSTFWFELALTDRQISADEDKGGEEQNLSSAEHVSTVVYVEDNLANLRVVQALFRHYPQLRLISAINGEQGLELISKNLPDVIILDMHLPGISGLDVLAALRKNSATQHIPVIALSADAMPTDIENGLKAGIKTYLTKPLDTELLMSEVFAAIA